MSQENIDKKILKALAEFSLDLTGKTVLTEAASGNYASTCVIASLAGAEVYAYTKNSRYATVQEVKNQVNALASKLGALRGIRIIESFDGLDLRNIDIVTNTGFLRPLDSAFVNRLSRKCVIPLMWEPWEYRPNELDLDACAAKGIKVYGTNESDPRLRTMEYMGYVLLRILLNNGFSPLGSRLLILGCERFVVPALSVLKNSGYAVRAVTDYSEKIDSPEDYDAFILLEHERNLPLIGGRGAYLNVADIPASALIVHICGNIDKKDLSSSRIIPENPALFGHMSFSTDYADPKAVVDLHTAGLKVAEGMLEANTLGLQGTEYRDFMEKNYPALSFDNPQYW
ncbi:MAG: hypothetical protein A2017_14815 [Lentisphaerae bacterium GWF2_44_16]|nr:MAG: hypothetical protein A2017_14815 [Lentisphaerae bacterium GWF2_44_16]